MAADNVITNWKIRVLLAFFEKPTCMCHWTSFVGFNLSTSFSFVMLHIKQACARSLLSPYLSYLFGRGPLKNEKVIKKCKNWKFGRPENLSLVRHVPKWFFKNQLDILNLELTLSEKFGIRFYLWRRL